MKNIINLVRENILINKSKNIAIYIMQKIKIFWAKKYKK